ncbi:MAG: hypothetical protein ACD_51C00150G0003 [uncultured bacterium]|nr:MAG: hypothetical protein ACD_51C00150G0003 [uncultured bacterium]OGJ48182.1 MAG: hypothetical protein A2344_01075 [Candidatus Peregrinibacteria bacterium RIFOXYB12_FULL_41_12]OGJ48293.1 MAG: hypothetical protein A2244_02135 [Candidatus Peregrinibacteria bacterium RIFOXYA2_FULL_41_18]OGJ54415.1 MAG: hypothetical protein A2336_03115 [Candidatus Peregrinibacteria bacterium RIFOXYB2_FULL_41_88]
MLSEIFQILGLRGKDIRIYLSSLRLGPQPASVIARKTGLKRVDTYNHLIKLCGIGVFRIQKRGKVAFFSTCAPEQLSDLIKIKKSLIVEAERGLERISNI